jgi:hypothetical protein
VGATGNEVDRRALKWPHVRRSQRQACRFRLCLSFPPFPVLEKKGRKYSKVLGSVGNSNLATVSKYGIVPLRRHSQAHRPDQPCTLPCLCAVASRGTFFAAMHCSGHCGAMLVSSLSCSQSAPVSGAWHLDTRAYAYTVQSLRRIFPAVTARSQRLSQLHAGLIHAKLEAHWQRFIGMRKELPPTVVRTGYPQGRWRAV